jgi:hypothetical protein
MTATPTCPAFEPLRHPECASVALGLLFAVLFFFVPFAMDGGWPDDMRFVYATALVGFTVGVGIGPVMSFDVALDDPEEDRRARRLGALWRGHWFGVLIGLVIAPVDGAGIGFALAYLVGGGIFGMGALLFHRMRPQSAPAWDVRRRLIGTGWAAWGPPLTALGIVLAVAVITDRAIWAGIVGAIGLMGARPALARATPVNPGWARGATIAQVLAVGLAAALATG